MRHILMVDDQVELLQPLGRLLEREGYRVSLAADGREALQRAAADHPDLVVADLNMPGMDGYELVQRLRRLRATALVPILFLSGQGDTPKKVEGLRVGADDYLVKPIDWEELKARIAAAFDRGRRSAGTNPLTGLPGNTAIEEEITRRINERAAFALVYVDLDFFKSYNDTYGFAKGDEVLRSLGQVLTDAVEKAGTPEDFVGHIGGDDFVLVTSPQTLDPIVSHAIEMFDWLAPAYYSEADRERGGINTKDRKGQAAFHPILRLSVGAASTDVRPFATYAEAAGVASEMKKYAKTLKRGGSFFAKDRRTQG